MVEDMNAIATAKSLILALLVVGTQGGPESRLAWPLSPEPMVTRSFQAPDGRYGAGHRGVDLAATPGQQVLAAGPGVVVFAGTVAGCGVVAVDRDGGLRTTYEPVAQPSPPGIRSTKASSPAPSCQVTRRLFGGMPALGHQPRR
jgi:murein DD-endopeptidase MepM/ murein hydrolase activator NlpD